MEIKDQQEVEVIVNQFEVEELEDRLENKWSNPCPTVPKPGTNCNINF